MAHGDDYRVVGIEVLWIELVVVGLDHGAACVTILLFHLVQLVLHHLLTKLRVIENLVQIVDGLHQLVKLVVQLLQAQACELAQTHIHNRLALQFIQLETLLQVALSIRRSLAGTDNMYHLVDIVAGDDQTFQDMSTLLCLLQFELSTTDRHVMTMVYEILHALLQAQQTRTATHKGDTIHRERAL